MTQNNLGNALRVLGERERGTARLEQAVAAYQAALEEWTRERVPLDWAMTQNNLGNALRVLGERERGTARLEQAVAAFQAALQEWTTEATPHWREIAQRDLARCLATLEQPASKSPVLLGRITAMWKYFGFGKREKS
jgi:tetratricopeptide (TPR) repeat protein